VRSPSTLAVVAIVVSLVPTVAYAADTSELRFRLGAGLYAATLSLIVLIGSMFDGFIIRCFMWVVGFTYLLFCFVVLGVFIYYLPSAIFLLSFSYRRKSAALV
jgi:hypothetical protein